MAEHTPGPWRTTHRRVVERPTTISRHFAIAPVAGPTMAFLPEGRLDTQHANAVLMSAAPELLAACKSALSDLNTHDTSAEYPWHEATVRQLEAAIARAEVR
jgi:hypothetical protein